MFEPLFTKVITDLIKIFREDPQLRRVLWAIPMAFVVAAVFGILDATRVLPSAVAQVGEAIAFGAIVITAFSLSAYRSVVEEKARQDRIDAKEEEVKRSPEKTKAAWDLAQERLEGYLDRNIAQVRSIYWLCVFVMLVGFALVAYGTILIVRNPSNLEASTLASISGILISFLGGSFMVIYKSTMTQAKEYVAMLERINAVGMSLQIIDSLEASNGPLKDQSKAELARELLKFYGKQTGA